MITTTKLHASHPHLLALASGVNGRRHKPDAVYATLFTLIVLLASEKLFEHICTSPLLIFIERGRFDSSGANALSHNIVAREDKLLRSNETKHKH
jgi:hypothetical protein